MFENVDLRIAAAVLVFAGAGCGYSGPPTTGTSLRMTVSPFASGSRYAYVDDNEQPAGHVYVYALPLTAHSRPLRDIHMSGPGSIAFGKQQVYVVQGGPSGSQNQGILVFVRTKQMPSSFVLSLGPLFPDMLEVDNADGTFKDDLFQGQINALASYSSYQVNVFKAPITPNSVPAFTMDTAVNNKGRADTRGMNFDTKGDLWIKDDDNQTMDEFVPPFSGKSVAKLRFRKGAGTPYGSMIFDSNDVMYVTDGGAIDVYDPPYTRHTKKAFTIGVVAVTNTLALDSTGNLYVSCEDGNIYVYAPPLSASSTPQVIMPVPGTPSLPTISIKS